MSSHFGYEVEETILKQFHDGYHQKELFIYKDYVLFLVENRGMYLYDKKKDICRCIQKMFIEFPYAKILENFDNAMLFMNEHYIVLKRRDHLEVFSYDFQNFPETFRLEKFFETKEVESRSDFSCTRRYLAFQLAKLNSSNNTFFLIYDLQQRKMALKWRIKRKIPIHNNTSLEQIKMNNKRIMISSSNCIEIYRYREDSIFSVKLEKKLDSSFLYPFCVSSFGLGDDYFFIKSFKDLYLYSFHSKQEKKISLYSPRYNQYVFSNKFLLLYTSSYHVNNIPKSHHLQLIHLENSGTAMKFVNCYKVGNVDENNNFYYFDTHHRLVRNTFIHKLNIDLYFYVNVLNKTLLGENNEDVKRIIVDFLKYKQTGNFIEKKNQLYIEKKFDISA